MSKVVAVMSITLAGYVADPPMAWPTSSTGTGPRGTSTFKMPSAGHLPGLWSELGASQPTAAKAERRRPAGWPGGVLAPGGGTRLARRTFVSRCWVSASNAPRRDASAPFSPP